MIEQTINLRASTHTIPRVIHAVEGDTGRTLKMILEDLTVASGMSAELSFRRSDDSTYGVVASIDTGNNAFIADITQALTRPGETQCQLKVSDANDLVVSTYTFIIDVQESTSGVPIEQMGVDIYTLIEAASRLRNFRLIDTYDARTQNLTITIGIESEG